MQLIWQVQIWYNNNTAGSIFKELEFQARGPTDTLDFKQTPLLADTYSLTIKLRPADTQLVSANKNPSPATSLAWMVDRDLIWYNILLHYLIIKQSNELGRRISLLLRFKVFKN